MKKLFKMIMVLAFAITCLMQSTLVNAAGNGKITITKAEIGKTYAIYKLFDLESYNSETGAYTYTIDTTSKWYDFVLNGAGKDYITLTDYTETKKIVSWNTNKNTESDHATFAKLALKYAKESNPVIAATDTKTAESTTVEFTGLDLGYYLIDSTVGTLCGLTTTKPSASVVEKNSVPKIEKEVDDNGTWRDESNAKIGDTIEYRTTITVKEGAENYVLTDTMTDGLTPNKDVKVYVDNKEVTAEGNYEVEYKNNGFVLTFKDSYIKNLPVNTVITVRYSAVLNEKAKVCAGQTCDHNDNKTYLEYGDKTDKTNKTPEKETKTYTYAFNLIKTKSDETTELTGAEFLLYDAEKGGNLIPVFKVSEGLYRVAKTEEEIEKAESIKVGNAIIEGLDSDKSYYLEETKNPDGYNKLTSRVKVEVKPKKKEGTTISAVDTTVKVANYTGTELPSTGGMGTVLFIVIGTLMVLGFGVLLITKLRISKMSI